MIIFVQVNCTYIYDYSRPTEKVTTSTLRLRPAKVDPVGVLGLAFLCSSYGPQICHDKKIISIFYTIILERVDLYIGGTSYSGGPRYPKPTK